MMEELKFVMVLGQEQDPKEKLSVEYNKISDDRDMFENYRCIAGSSIISRNILRFNG